MIRQYKVMAIAILLAGSGANAAWSASSVSDLNSIQAQQANMQQQIDQLNQSLRNTDTIALKKQNVALKKDVKDIKKQLSKKSQNYVVLDMSKDRNIFEKFSSSHMPLSVLENRNDYAPNTLVLGGYLENETQGWWGDSFDSAEATQDYSNGVGNSITTANLDALVNISDWAQAYMQLDFIGAPAVESAFITFGNLSKTPYFLTLGKSRMRFGLFPGAPWAASIGQGLFRPGHINNVALAYDKGNLNLNLVYFQGDSSDSKVNLMASTFYHSKIGKSDVSYELNGALMSDIRGSGMGAASAGFTRNTPAIDFEGELGYKNYSAIAGWMSTMKKDVVTNNKLAGVLSIEGDYSHKILSKDVTFALAYNGAYNTQKMPMSLAGKADDGPKLYGVQKEVYAYALVAMTKELYFNIEYAWMETYTHKNSNEITLDTSLYF